MSLPHLSSGKVRDIYDAGDGRLLIVASDRISAFDVVMAEPIPDKGRVLTAITEYWLDLLADVAPNHRISSDPNDFPPDAKELPDIAGRAMLVRKADMIPLECIVRGYLTGSALKEYRASGTMHGSPLPAGLDEAHQLPEPVFTPSTKAEIGEHDVNLSYEQAVDLVGTELAEAARRISIEAYTRAAARAAEKGIIIADTKFELGWIDGKLSLCDEVLTPDSSRFWPADEWVPGKVTPSYDKQPLRDWLEGLGWDKKPPPPALPADIVEQTAQRYRAAYERITGKSLDDWFGA